MENKRDEKNTSWNFTLLLLFDHSDQSQMPPRKSRRRDEEADTMQDIGGSSHQNGVAAVEPSVLKRAKRGKSDVEASNGHIDADATMAPSAPAPPLPDEDIAPPPPPIEEQPPPPPSSPPPPPVDVEALIPPPPPPEADDERRREVLQEQEKTDEEIGGAEYWARLSKEEGEKSSGLASERNLYLDTVSHL